ncbi:spermatogenesis-associated protein 20-like [Penaeus monodon]|uniref:spermatogenesis-associated protein 20-like n=1 Tax=Penaeus monodon TaxID=6687 RepID=UPI0018A7D297|nr:spermatogenesis-associated protein 20-like [Penaeus monodon]
MATAGEGSASDGTGKLNRLASEKSPYLLQHASNPVDWYPWSEEAFSVAKRENKLIFLSVGYSTCHWCHVMERESFENPDIARIMNANFINVKVDREERPDVDKVYMTFVTSVSGSGGWPMSVWLTPDLKPIYGGTYFPPNNRYYGHPGFTELLVSIASQWKEDEGKFKESGKKIMEVLDRTSRLSLSAQSDLPGEEAIARCYAQLSRSYEPQYGGFGESPKFPQPANFNFLFTYYALNPDQDDAKKSLEMALFTLKKMDQGGIHDHVAQGFARYFKRHMGECWGIGAPALSGLSKFMPHQITMLEYSITKQLFLCGGFYSAEDADSLPTHDAKEKREGAFCVWTYEEINQLLAGPVKEGHDTTLANVFCHHFSVAEGGNVNPYQDPHDELKNQNVLIEHCSIEETGEEFGLSEEECKAALTKSCKILYDIRQKRPKPHLDNKMLTSWNGMMLGAMARAGVILGEKSYIERAIQAADFVKTYLFKDGLLLRSAYSVEDGQVSVGSSLEGFVDDYAWMIRGFLNLYEATLDTSWLELAEELQDKENELFWDSQEAGYFMTKAGDSSILLRIKEDQDGAEPSANSVSVGNLLRLSPLLDRADYREKAEAIFQLFAERLNKIPIALPEMTTALLIHKKHPVQIILAGKKGTDATQKMLQAVHGHLIPSHVILLADENHESLLYNRHSSLRHYHPKKPDETVAHVCQNFRCSLPVSNPEQLEETLNNPCFVVE